MNGWNRVFKLGIVWVVIVTVYFASLRLGLTDAGTAGHGHSTLQVAVSDNQPTIEGAAIQHMWEQGHKLPNADAFLEHFKKVVQVKGMTMAEAKSSCTWGPFEIVNFQYTGDTDWVVHERTDEEIDLRRRQWQEYVLTKMLPWENFKDRFMGKGIVILAGNDHGLSVKRLRVVLRELRKVNSEIPVELHYWRGEISEETRNNLTATWPLIFFNDLSNPKTNILLTTDHSPLINYQYKPVALVNSRFAEPLLLDNDNIPVIDPLLLYESETYQEFGTIFWPDIARTRPNNPMWPITNTGCRMNEYEQESGQMLVDKRRYWYHLQLAAMFNDDGVEGYYSSFLLGDKDTFRFAWHALKTRFGKPTKWVTSIGTLSPTEDANDLELDGGYYCGHTMAQFHPDAANKSVVAFLHGGTLKTMDKEVLRWQRNARGGIFQAFKQSVNDEKPEVSVEAFIKWDDGSRIPKQPNNLGIGSCVDMKGVKPQPFKELNIQGWEKRYEEIGGYFAIDEV